MLEAAAACLARMLSAITAASYCQSQRSHERSSKLEASVYGFFSLCLAIGAAALFRGADTCGDAPVVCGPQAHAEGLNAVTVRGNVQREPSQQPRKASVNQLPPEARAHACRRQQHAPLCEEAAWQECCSRGALRSAARGIMLPGSDP